MLRAEEGSLYPALHRMEEAGWIRAKWITKETGRRARIYEVTAAGNKQIGCRGVSLAGSDFGGKSRFADGVICRLWSRFWNVFREDRLNREIEEEFEAHIAEAVEQGRDRGRSAARAGRGGAAKAGESRRPRRWMARFTACRVVFGWRQLKRNRATSAAAILSLALAIGACTAAFRLIDALLLCGRCRSRIQSGFIFCREQGMGFDNKPGSVGFLGISGFPTDAAAAKGQAELIALSYADRSDVTYKTDDEMEKANLQYVSGGMFATFGIEPVLGRLFTGNDDRKPGGRAFRGALLRLLESALCTRSSGDWSNPAYRRRVYEIVGVSEEKFTGTERGR